MRKILIPIYNDWESLQRLIEEINKNIKDFDDINFECLIVNDASTIQTPELQKPSKFSSIEIFNMKENKGHARCNAFGIRYILQNKKFDNLILMDGDGEDRPEEIKNLIDKINENPNLSVVAKRVKRSEGPFFNFYIKCINLLLLYSRDKMLTLEIIVYSQKVISKTFFKGKFME